ncbi:pectinesterase family protein [Flindersiella endophytica]
MAAWAGAGRLDRSLGNPTDPAVAGNRFLRAVGAPHTETADGPVWSPRATGFASTPSDDLPEGTIGGTGGRTVIASDAASLARHAASTEPLTIVVRGEIQVEPFGSMIRVASNKTIVGLGPRAALVGGGLFLDGVHNVIVRNLTFRDSYVPADWDGKSADNDNDGIRLDTSSHVWIDHNEFARLGDGLVDVRQDSTAVTLSWNRFLDHNKAIGVGWTTNVITTITLHHNWFANTYQRNASVDNVAAGHLYNNYLDGFGQYGTMSRGAAQLVVEASYYVNGEDPIVAKDADSKVDSRGNRFLAIRGRRDQTGSTFEPSQFYAYQVDPVDDVPAIVTAGAGPVGPIREIGRRVRVALDGSGDFASIGAAVGAAARATHPVEIVVAPGTYREVVRVFPDADHLTIRGTTRDPADVVLTYDIAAGQQKFYGGTFGSSGSATLAVFANDVTLRNLTVRNDYDEAANGPSQSLALRTIGDRIVLDGVRLIGNQDTYLAESPSRDVQSRVYATRSYVEGDVDFIYGRATAVFANSTIRSLDRHATVNGYVTAASTVTGNPHGFLFTGCRFVSDAAAGSVFLGRPWHPSSDPNTDPAVVVRDSWLGAHIGTPAWTDMSGWSWRDAEFFEYRNTGPGAATGDGRPQLTEEQAASATVASYLAGPDGWSPWRR